MATVRLSDVIVPAKFTEYVVENSTETSNFVKSGVISRNARIEEMLKTGSNKFTVPFWNDLSNDEADVTNDDPSSLSTPEKLNASSMDVRKSFLHQSWSAMNLASELAGDSAMERIQTRVSDYWSRQLERRLIASLNGILADNVANDGSDMVLDITGEAGDAAKFSATAVIDATATLGDLIGKVTGIAMHSDIYRAALKADLIQFIPDSRGGLITTYRGLAVLVDDMMPRVNTTVDPEDPPVYEYTTALFGGGAVGYGMTEPNEADGTELESTPSAGNGAGEKVLHSRVNLTVHPSGFSWVEGSIAAGGPTLAQLAEAAHWNRVVERRAVPMAFLISK